MAAFLHKLWPWVKYPLLLAVLLWLLFTAAPALQRLPSHGIDWVQLLLGLVVFQLAILLFARRFQLVLLVSGIKRGYMRVLLAYVRSIIYFFITPGGLGVEAARFQYLKDSQHDGAAGAGELVSALLVDRLLGMFAALLLGAMGAGVLVQLLAEVDLHSIYLLLLAFVGLKISAYVLWRWRRAWFQNMFLNLRQSYAANKSALLRAALYSVLLQFIMGFAIYLCALAFHVQVDLTTVVWATAAGMVLMVLPVNAGGFGLNDAGTALLLHAAGVPLVDATVIVLIGYLLRLWSGVQSGLLELVPKLARKWHA